MVSKNSKSSLDAAKTLGIKYETYKKHAKRLGCFIERQDKLTQSEYLAKVNEINPNIEVLDKYINIRTKIKHRCKICNYIWDVSPNDIRNGNGCPICNQSKGEKEIRKYLDNLCIKYEVQKTFEDCKLKGYLKFDFYIPTLNMCIEYDGRQHFEPVDFSGRGIDWANEQFKLIKYRDSLKSIFCEEHNIKLVRIKYTENINKKLDSIFIHT